MPGGPYFPAAVTRVSGTGMRAAYITEHGPPEVINVGKLPEPSYGPTDVLVRVEAVAANPVDT